MFMTKYRPSMALDAIFDSNPFSHQMRSCFTNDKRDSEAFRLPKTNVNELEKEYVLTMEMPGVSKENIEVNIEDDQIVVRGEKTDKVTDEGLRRREYRSEAFRRSFRVDSTIDRENIKAKLENGILKVTLPKRAESVGRKVDID